MIQRLRGNRWFTLSIIVIGFFIILIDATVVNVSIPSIAKELHAHLSDIEWVISGYALFFAALLITFGRLGDIFGRRNMFIAGLFVFGLASFFSGEAGNTSVLIIARFAQGVGGAMISPSVLSLIAAKFSGKERAVAFGIFGSITGIAVAIGPVLGGFFTTYYSWRWVFRINIPICIIGIILSLIFIQESLSPHRSEEKIDVLGMLYSSLGFFFLVFGLIEGQNYGWLIPSKPFQLGPFLWNNPDISIIFISFILAAVFLVAFTIVEFNKTVHKAQPAVNFDFFAFKTYRYGLIAIAVIALGEFSSLFTLPLFLQGVRGLNALQSGLATLPLAAASFIAAPSAAQLVNRLGSKWIITFGIILEGVGVLLLSLLTIHTTPQELIIPFAILGAGIGLAISQNTQVILSQIPPQNAGSASGVLNTIRQVGSALGVAIVGAVLSAQISTNIPHQINTLTQVPQSVKNTLIAQAQSNDVTLQQNGSSGSSITPTIPVQIQNNPQAISAFKNQVSHMQQDIKQAVDTGFVDSISVAIRIASIFLFLGALLSLLIPTVKHKE